MNQILNFHAAVPVEQDLPLSGGGVQAVDGLAAQGVVVGLAVPGQDIHGHSPGAEGAEGAAVIDVEGAAADKGEIEGVAVKETVAEKFIGIAEKVQNDPVIRFCGDVDPVGAPVPGHLAVEGLRYGPDRHQGAVIQGDGGHIQGDGLLVAAHLLGHPGGAGGQLDGGGALAGADGEIVVGVPLHGGAQALEDDPKGHQDPVVHGRGRLVKDQALAVQIDRGLSGGRGGEGEETEQQRQKEQPGQEGERFFQV